MAWGGQLVQEVQCRLWCKGMQHVDKVVGEPWAEVAGAWVGEVQHVWDHLLCVGGLAPLVPGNHWGLS